MDAQNYKPAERLGPSFICFLIWTFIVVARPMDYMSFLMPLRPVLTISIITLLVMFFERPEHSRPIFQSTEAKLVFLLYFVMLAGVPFAVHRGAAFQFVAIIMPSVIIYFIVSLKQLNSMRKINTTVAVIAVSILFSATLYAVVALAHRGFRTEASQVYDPNDIAMLFATFIPLCLYILFGPYGLKLRLISGVAIILGATGIMLSGSRGGVLAFGTTVVIFLMSRAPKIGMIARVAIVAVLVLVSVNYSEIVEERFQNFGNDYNFSEENGRLNIWKQNFAIISENPFLGTGAGCSTISLGLYRAQVGGNQAWYSSHSSVFQFAVDNGIPAFIVYCILNILAIVNLRRIHRDEGHPLSNIAFFVELSFYGFWVGGLLLSHAYSINLFVLLGISASLSYFYRHEPGMNKSDQIITKQE